ncbi:hypothetical protein SHELI_v1c03710 [Spiroplasma helicoides]|uniref:Uncharacterized protein n=1 Tax=Spiroplasma helicoides TaxID=216938 RepID=A0A1B3SK68_9MOLU|nr:hypothetical protein [Spiroplasma helicoides]AOG60324.1 hypothetical protein SHELI_v1c03710 [Spiroplasma helicoides]
MKKNETSINTDDNMNGLELLNNKDVSEIANRIIKDEMVKKLMESLSSK